MLICSPKVICNYYINILIILTLIPSTYTLILRLMWVLPSIRVMLLSVINDYLIDGMLHAYIYIFWLLMSGLFGGISNLLIPILISTKEVIYPQLNILSLNILMVSIVIAVCLVWLVEYVTGIGWTLYVPLSVYSSSNDMLGIDMFIFSIMYVVISSTISIIVFISSMMLIRLIVCTLLLVNVVIIIGMLVVILVLFVIPIIIVLVICMFVEIHMYSCMYDIVYGGDVLLFQHMFWLFGHPEVYVLIFPVISMCMFSGNIIVLGGIINVSVSSICYINNTGSAMLNILVLSMYVWCHHMWCISICIDVVVCYCMLSLLVSVPTGLKSVLIMLLLS